MSVLGGVAKEMRPAQDVANIAVLNQVNRNVSYGIANLSLVRYGSSDQLHCLYGDNHAEVKLCNEAEGRGRTEDQRSVSGLCDWVIVLLHASSGGLPWHRAMVLDGQVGQRCGATQVNHIDLT